MLIVILFVSLGVACKKTENTKTDIPVARVYNKYLYGSQINNIVPLGLSNADSITIVKDYIDKWIRKQLLVYQAEQYLSETEKNVEQQIDDYRSSLLIFKYEQNYIKQKLDTIITDHDVEDYYTNNSSNFILNNQIIKGLFIQVPKNAIDIPKVRKFYKSDKVDDLKELESYCYKYASKYEYFDENWIYFSKIYNNLPETYIRPEDILQKKKYYETEDSTNYYFLKVSDYRLSGSITPLEFIKEDIKSILLNKRKIQLIEKLESNIYNDALNRENFKIIK
jgi:hypothetical protein